MQVDTPAAIICQEQFQWDCQVALLIVYGPTAHCPHGESSGQPDAVSPDGRYRGLFQVDDGPLDPYENTLAAYGMWQERGWQPWTCKPEWVA